MPGSPSSCLDAALQPPGDVTSGWKAWTELKRPPRSEGRLGPAALTGSDFQSPSKQKIIIIIIIVSIAVVVVIIIIINNNTGPQAAGPSV